MVEETLEMDAFNVVRKIGSKTLVQLLNGLVEHLRLILAVGHGQARIADCVRTQRITLHHIHQFQSDVFPVVQRIYRSGWGHHAQMRRL